MKLLNYKFFHSLRSLSVLLCISLIISNISTSLVLAAESDVAEIEEVEEEIIEETSDEAYDNYKVENSEIEVTTEMHNEDIADSSEMTELGDDREWLPVYDNMTNVDIMGDSKQRVIGYCVLKEGGKAVYGNAFSSSASPDSDLEITVPRRLVVTSYDGVDTEGNEFSEYRVYDYTEGDYLDSEGYALQTEGGIRRTDEETGEDIYIGDEYYVDELDEEVFKNCYETVRINLPKTIQSDITWEFFRNCKKASVISMYDKNDESSRYDTGTSKYESTKGVLVDKRPKDLAANSMIIWCPPRYSASTYKYYLGEYRSPGVIIGPHAFEGCVNLVEVGPQTSGNQKILEIGEKAFKGCTSLSKASVFDSNLRSIGDEAFFGCRALESVRLNATAGTVLGNAVFAQTAIKSLGIPAGYNDMRGETFVSMNSLSAFELVPNKDEEYNNYFAVSENVLYRLSEKGAEFEKGVELVCFPSKKTTRADDIDPARTVRENGAFLVPYQVTGFDSHCFYMCDNIVTVYFPSTIMDLGKDCFYSCENLGNLYFFSGLPKFSLKPSEYSDTYIFEGCRSNLLTIYAGKNTPIYNYAAGCDKNLGIRYVSLYDPDAYTYVVKNGKAYLTDVDESYGIQYSDIYIPNYYIAGTEIFPVVGVNSAALAKKGITSVTFLHDMSAVAQDAFYYMANPQDLSDEDNINASDMIAVYVEYGNFNLLSEQGVLYKQELDTYSNEYYISELLYYPAGNKNIEYTTVKGLNTLPEYAFWGAASLRYINIYDDIQYIGRKGKTYLTEEPTAFAGCRGLCMVNIISDEKKPTNPNFIEYYSDLGVLYKWDHNSGESGEPVTLIFYPKGQRSMQIDGISPSSYEVVDGCNRIKDMKDCKFLNTIIVPKSVTTIDDAAFSGCAGLKELIFKETGNGYGIRSIGNEAFANTALLKLELPNTIKEIGDKAFYYCVSLTEINIQGDELISIGDKAFMGDRSIVKATISCAKQNESGGDVNIGNYAFYRCVTMKEFVLDNMGRTTLGDYSVAYCSELNKLKVESTSIVDMGKGTFAEDKKLTSVDLMCATMLESIDEKAFFGCERLETVNLPSYVKRIGRSAFEGCKNLKNFNFSALTQVESISANAFSSCGFVSVLLPNSVHELGEGVFEASPLMYTMFVPENVEFVKDSDGDYGTAEGPYVNPFKDFGKEFYVYGIEGSDVDKFISWMDAHGFKAPTFIGSATMPKAVVYIDEAEYTLYDMGETQPTITAVVTSEEQLVDYSVKWLTTDDTIIKILECTSDGKGTNYCKIEGLAKGSAELYAINPQTGAYTYCRISVKAASVEVAQNDIKLNTKGSNRTEKISATSYPTRKIYYKSNSKRVATVSDKGIIKGRGEGTTTIIVYAGKDDHYVEKEVNVTVYKPTIKVNKTKIKLNEKGDPQQLSANVLISHTGAYETVTWTSSNSRVATVEGDDYGCSIVAKRAGKCYITAECNGLKKKISVNVMPVNTTLNSQSLTLYCSETTGETFALKAKTSGISHSVYWESEDENVAVVDANGKVTAIAAGETFVKATANGYTTKCKVTVKEASIKLYAARGDSVNEKTAITINSRGDNQYELVAKIVGRDTKVTWTSTAKEIFTVDASGVVTGKIGGTADLLATANGCTAVCSVTVIDTETELDYPDITLYLDSKDNENIITVNVQIQGADPDKKLTWEIEDNNIAGFTTLTPAATYEPTEFGGTGMATIVAKKKGKTRMRVTANGVADYCNIYVK